MHHNAGITVLLAEPRVDDGIIKEYHNPLIYDLDDYGGKAQSCQIFEQPGRFALCIEVSEDFELYRARGIYVVVSVGHGHQVRNSLNDVHAFWIAAEANGSIAGRYQIHLRKTWTLGGTRQKRVFKLPTPDNMLDAQNGVYSLIGPFNATKGAVTVSVTRGSLTEAMEKDSSFVAATTEPPYNYRALAAGVAKKLVSIRWRWFTHLRSDNGKPYVFEFKNMGKSAKTSQDGDDPTSEADDLRSTHASHTDYSSTHPSPHPHARSVRSSAPEPEHRPY